MKSTARILLCLSIVSITSGCDDTKKALGFERTVPDEFRVSSHPPLSLPPDYGLRPPGSMESRPPEASATEKAIKTLGISEDDKNDDNRDLSAAERSFLKKAGGDQASDSIRDTLKTEDKSLNDNKDSLWEKFKEGTMLVDKKDKPSNVLDPMKEHKRLETEKSGGTSDSGKTGDSSTSDSSNKSGDADKSDPAKPDDGKLPATLEGSGDKAN